MAKKERHKRRRRENPIHLVCANDLQHQLRREGLFSDDTGDGKRHVASPSGPVSQSSVLKEKNTRPYFNPKEVH